MAIDQRLFDDVVENALNILRLAAGERARTVQRLQEMEAELIHKLSEENITGFERARIETFISEADEIIGKHYGFIEADLEFSDIAQAVAETTVASLVTVLGPNSLKLPTTDYFNSVNSDVLIQGAPSADWWRGQTADTQFKFAAEVRKGLLAAENNQQIISRIVGTKGVPGVMDIARRNAASLVQTSVQTVANDARRTTYDANDDIIKGLHQVSTLDGHTSIVCVSYSGAEWNMAREPINGNTLPFNGGCPRHFNCRSLEVPITKTFRELGIDIDEAPTSTRASADGQISADTTFDGFLRRKGKAYQDEVLGNGRAELWRSGKITLRDLVNGDGRPISLDQLRTLAANKK